MLLHWHGLSLAPAEEGRVGTVGWVIIPRWTVGVEDRDCERTTARSEGSRRGTGGWGGMLQRRGIERKTKRWAKGVGRGDEKPGYYIFPPGR